MFRAKNNTCAISENWFIAWNGLKSIFKDGHQNNIIDKMQTRKRLYELVEYEKYNTPDKKITDFKTEGHE